ncbi:MAG: UDP-N-acetylenolpyruvoylglucosamine reductase, partial [Gammaproteobacteria bacterium]|nr:UDP-N-acetylenolpyruvoylglucosamine reductase [Gammaproteobacteria bacterium]
KPIDVADLGAFIVTVPDEEQNIYLSVFGSNLLIRDGGF